MQAVVGALRNQHQATGQHTEVVFINGRTSQHLEYRHHAELGGAKIRVGPGWQLVGADVVGQHHHPQISSKRSGLCLCDGNNRLELGETRSHQPEDRARLPQLHPSALDQPLAIQKFTQEPEPVGIERKTVGLTEKQPVD